MAVVPSGIVRASLPLGSITTADAFNVLSLGTGADGTPGYPLVSMYLTGKELKALAEVDATVSDMMPEARLYISGMSYTINSSRLILNRAVDIKQGVGEEATALENSKLYRVVADLLFLPDARKRKGKILRTSVYSSKGQRRQYGSQL